jgi:hypothetical protein
VRGAILICGMHGVDSKQRASVPKDFSGSRKLFPITRLIFHCDVPGYTATLKNKK